MNDFVINVHDGPERLRPRFIFSLNFETKNVQDQKSPSTNRV